MCEDAQRGLGSCFSPLPRCPYPPQGFGSASMGEHLVGGEMPFLTWPLFRVPLPSSVPRTTSSARISSPKSPSSCLENSTAALSWQQQLWAGFRASHLPICAPPGLCLAPTGVCAGALSLLAPHAQQHPLPCLASLSLPQGKEVEERQMAFCRLDVTHIL